MASEIGSVDSVKMLLDAGADVLLQTFTGRTALACAETGMYSM